MIKIQWSIISHLKLFRGQIMLADNNIDLICMNRVTIKKNQTIKKNAAKRTRQHAMKIFWTNKSIWVRVNKKTATHTVAVCDNFDRTSSP